MFAPLYGGATGALSRILSNLKARKTKPTAMRRTMPTFDVRHDRTQRTFISYPIRPGSRASDIDRGRRPCTPGRRLGCNQGPARCSVITKVHSFHVIPLKSVQGRKCVGLGIPASDKPQKVIRGGPSLLQGIGCSPDSLSPGCGYDERLPPLPASCRSEDPVPKAMPIPS